MTVCSYGTAGGYPDASTPGPPNRGTKFFGGGFAARSTISQVINVSSSSSQIDAGNFPFALSAYLGGFSDQDDNAAVRATFKNSAGATLGATASIGPVLAAERNRATSLILKTASGTVPAGTRNIEVVLEFVRSAGSSNDGYADNLSLILGTGGGGGGGGGTGTYTLSRIELSRTYGATFLSDNAVKPPKETLGSDQRSFQLGWDFLWPDGKTGPNRNRSVGTVGLTQVPTSITPGSSVSFAATMAGEWITSGYGVSRDHTVRLAGVAGAGQYSIVDNPSGTYRGQFNANNTLTVPQPDAAGQIALILNATVRFGDDHTGAMEIKLVYGGAPGGGGGSCAYFVNPLTQSIGGGGGTGLVNVVTAQGCTWTAVSNVTWITIAAGALGNGNGAVSYSVAANPNTTTRTGTLTIAGQTHTVTQAAASSCSFTLSSTSVSVAASGGTGSVSVTASASTCAWTAASSAPWLTITSAASGTGNGTVNYSAAANPNTTARAATLTIAGQTFTVNQAAASVSNLPTISAGGVVNAASYIPATLPAGAIAQGSFFSIFGSELGPPQTARADAYPLTVQLAEVSVRVTQGSTSVDALPVFVSPVQINAILPSNTPLGDVSLTVTYRGRTSAPARVKVTRNNFGVFSTAGGRGPAIFQNFVSQTETPLNTLNNPARPRQAGILWGTGLGPITARDDLAPPAGNLPFPVEVFVGGKRANILYSGRTPCCAGVDQIVIEIPADAPMGCYVPVQVKVADTFSNGATIALDAQGGRRCSDPTNPFGPLLSSGGKTGGVILARLSALAQLEAGKPAQDLTLDIGAGLFNETKAGGDLAYNPILSVPPVGACQSFAGDLDLSNALGGTIPGLTTDPSGRDLDAGPGLSVTQDSSGRTIQMPYSDADKKTSPYFGLLGGSLPLLGAPSLPLFLTGGSFTIAGTGGKDVGPFRRTVNLQPPVTWTNRASVTSVNRSSGLTLTWNGGDPSSQVILIAGASTDQKNKATGGFLCIAPANAGSFRIGAEILSNLPATGANLSLDDTEGVLAIGAVPAGNLPTFTASGLDLGYIMYLSLDIKTLPYQ